MADYATVTEIKSLGLQTDAPDSAVWVLLASAASRQFDRLCEVPDDFFAKAADPVDYSDRDFYGDGTAFLKLDPFTSLNPIDPVVMDPETSYSLPEYSVVNYSLVVLSRTRPQSPESALYGYRFTGWPQAVKVTVSANWGFPAIPAEVKLVVCKLAMNSWRLSDPVNAEKTEAEAEPIIDGLPASVWPIVEAMRKKYSRAALFA